MADRLRTGIDVLDRKLEGGLPAGSVVALCAAPASQAELFLYELTNTRETLYLSFDRDEHAVADGVFRLETRISGESIEVVGREVKVEQLAHAVLTSATTRTFRTFSYSVSERRQYAFVYT